MKRTLLSSNTDMSDGAITISIGAAMKEGGRKEGRMLDYNSKLFIVMDDSNTMIKSYQETLPPSFHLPLSLPPSFLTDC